MSDKEFDAFFKASLGQFEEEASKAIWAAIDAENQPLEGEKYKRSKLPIIWIAACFLLLGFGWMYLNRPIEKIQLRLEQEILAEIPQDISEKYQPKISSKQSEERHTSTSIANEQRFLELMAATTLEEKPKKEKKYKSNLIISNHQEAGIKESQLVKNVSNTPDKKDDAISVDEKAGDQELLLAQVEPIQENTEKVKSLGDLVNFVVSKIDKRENKIIHVSRTEECDMEITGINLGFIKYKKVY